METKLSAKRQEIRVELEAGGRTIAAGTGDEMDWIRGVARVAAEAAESVAGIHASAYALPSGAQATAQAVYDPKGIALTIGIPADAVQTVNGNEPDGQGNAQLDGLIYPTTAQALEAMSQEQQAALYAQGYRAIVATYNETVTMHALAADGSLAWIGCNQDTTNLLDNPDFAIAQAGYNGYHGAIKYVCDRWTTGNANVNLSGKTLTYSASISEGVPTSVVLLIQKIGDLKRLQGKNVTFAIKASGISVSSGEQFYMADSLFSVAGTGKNVAIQNGVNVYNFTAAESLTTDAAVIVWLPVNSTDQITASITIDEIALYEGEYTADTLPPWVAPDPATELIKCQAFFTEYDTGSAENLGLCPVYTSNNKTIAYGIMRVPVKARNGVKPTFNIVGETSLELYGTSSVNVASVSVYNVNRCTNGDSMLFLSVVPATTPLSNESYLLDIMNGGKVQISNDP